MDAVAVALQPTVGIGEGGEFYNRQPPNVLKLNRELMYKITTSCPAFAYALLAEVAGY